MLRQTAVRLLTGRRGGLRRRHADAVPELVASPDPNRYEDTVLLFPDGPQQWPLIPPQGRPAVVDGSRETASCSPAATAAPTGAVAMPSAVNVGRRS